MDFCYHLSNTMIIYVDIISGKDICSDSYPSESKVDGGVLLAESKRITEGAVNCNTGGNASAEGGGEEADDQAVSYINIVRSHQLESLELSKKEAKAYFKSMWKTVVSKLNAQILEAAGFEDDYKPPKSKKKAKAELKEYLDELDEEEMEEYEAAKAKMETFKGRFKALTAFVKTEILGNIDEFEFYTPSGAIFGECILIPARYVGAAESPTFYVFTDVCGIEKQ